MDKVYEITGRDMYQDGEIMYVPAENGPYQRTSVDSETRGVVIKTCDIRIYDRSIHDFRSPTDYERRQFENEQSQMQRRWLESINDEAREIDF